MVPFRSVRRPNSRGFLLVFLFISFLALPLAGRGQVNVLVYTEYSDIDTGGKQS